MVSADTNIVIRLLTEDDPLQTPLVSALFQNQPVRIAKTVLLETEWVLRAGFGFAPPQIREALVRLLGHPNARIEDRTEVIQALSFMAQGIDFADALHLAGTPPGVPFVTFDRTFVRRARRAGIEGISELTPAG